MKKILLLILLLGVCISGFETEAQRRAKPNSMKHSNEEIKDVLRETPVTCTYIKNNNTFVADVGYGDGGTHAMKIGTATLTFKGGKYSISVKSIQVKTKSTSKDVPRNRWKKENLYDNFAMTGKFETFEKNKKIYLRLYEDESGGRFPDIELTGKDAKSFTLNDDGMVMNFNLK